MKEGPPIVIDPPSIVFMGTPDFAVPSLNALHQSPFDLTWVITQPDRPRGRGRKLSPPPVKEAAGQMGYDVSQPPDVREDAFKNNLIERTPDFLVVVAFGQILPRSVLSIPKRGAINVHASLLPRYRGPAPIQWAIMRGEKRTGVTTMLMDQGVDTGDILLQKATPLDDTDTAATVHDRLAIMGAELLVRTIADLWSGKLHPRAQKHDQATYAPMLQKNTGRIQWHQSAKAIDALIRAMTPWPGAFCMFKNKRFKIHKAISIEKSAVTAPPGTIVPGFPDELRIATADGLLSILEIQVASGKRMPIKQFLLGNPLPPGSVFS